MDRRGPRAPASGSLAAPCATCEVAVVTGRAGDLDGAGDALPLLRASSQAFELFGTVPGAAPVDALHARLDRFQVVVVLDHAGRDPELAAAMRAPARRARLERWVRDGGALQLGVHDGAGGTPGVFGPRGFAMSGEDATRKPEVDASAPLLASPHPLASAFRAARATERRLAWPDEATSARDLVSGGAVTRFGLEAGHVFVVGVPVVTGAPEAPGLEDASGRGAAYFDNLLFHLRREAAGIRRRGDPFVPGDGRAPGSPSRSGLDLLTRGQARGDGVYWLDPDGAAPAPAVAATCLMSVDGGGWTVVARYARTWTRATPRTATAPRGAPR